MQVTIGTCSLCGGRVSVPSPYHSVIPPTPTCESCGAIQADYGPVIKMVNPRVNREMEVRIYGATDNTAGKAMW